MLRFAATNRLVVIFLALFCTGFLPVRYGVAQFLYIQNHSLTRQNIFTVGTEVLLKDPAGMNTRTRRELTGVVLSGRATYTVRIEFQLEKDVPEWLRTDNIRRVKLYAWSGKTNTNCRVTECWVGLKQFSTFGGLKHEERFIVTKQQKWLITSWDLIIHQEWQ